MKMKLNYIFSYEDENKEVPEEDKDKVVIYTTSLGVNRELVANCNRAIQIIRSYKVNPVYGITPATVSNQSWISSRSVLGQFLTRSEPLLEHF